MEILFSYLSNDWDKTFLNKVKSQPVFCQFILSARRIKPSAQVWRSEPRVKQSAVIYIHAEDTSYRGHKFLTEIIVVMFH